MSALPIHDRAGNALVHVRLAAQEDVVHRAERRTVPASVVVATYAGAVLMIFDSRRRQWELPGGMREATETARQAAVRELREETGIDNVDLVFAGVAEFDLVRPPRRETLAVYRARLTVMPQLATNDEALGFRWWPPHEPVSEDMSPLDAEIARRIVHTSTT